MTTNASQVAIIMGTRPEAIKLAGLARVLGERGRVIHTGQHYDATMWSNVLGDLAGVGVDEHIAIGGRSRGEQIGLATSEITRYLMENPVRAVVVQGDTNSTLAGGLAASSLGIPVVHVEAGLRSHDRRMPEELNRILVDAVSDLCCAPIAGNAEQLASEGVQADRIVVTGNTLADALENLAVDDAEMAELLASRGVEKDGYVLSTLHRAGAVDDRDTLAGLITALAGLAEQVPVLLPLHPRTAGNLDKWGMRDLLGRISVLEPLGPREFMALEQGAALIVSDSGGVQEEACFFRRPLVVVRDSTERPELLDGWCRLLGDADPVPTLAQAWEDAAEWRASLQDRPLPYGMHSASQLIVDEIDRRWPESAS